MWSHLLAQLQKQVGSSAGIVTKTTSSPTVSVDIRTHCLKKTGLTCCHSYKNNWAPCHWWKKVGFTCWKCYKNNGLTYCEFTYIKTKPTCCHRYKNNWAHQLSLSEKQKNNGADRSIDTKHWAHHGKVTITTGIVTKTWGSPAIIL
jgi:hypothetical protein